MGVWSSDMSVRASENSKRDQPGRVCREASCRKRIRLSQLQHIADIDIMYMYYSVLYNITHTIPILQHSPLHYT